MSVGKESAFKDCLKQPEVREFLSSKYSKKADFKKAVYILDDGGSIYREHHSYLLNEIYEFLGMSDRIKPSGSADFDDNYDFMDVFNAIRCKFCKPQAFIQLPINHPGDEQEKVLTKGISYSKNQPLIKTIDISNAEDTQKISLKLEDYSVEEILSIIDTYYKLGRFEIFGV